MTTGVPSPETPGVSVSDHPETAPTPSQDGVATPNAAPSPEETTPAYEPRYLGKKYTDLTQLEDAVSEKDRTINQSNQERNALTARLEAAESLLQQAGIDPQQVAPPPAQSAQPQVDVNEAVEQRLAPIKRQMALREEQDAIDEVIRTNPELAPVAKRMVHAWRVAGNEPLSNIVKDFKQLVAVGRNITVKETATQKEEAVETGTGVGAVTISAKKVQRQSALASHDLEALSATLPDDLGVL